MPQQLTTPLLSPPALPALQFQMVLLLASALGLTINHSTFVCTRVNEPLMTSVAGARHGVGWLGRVGQLHAITRCVASSLNLYPHEQTGTPPFIPQIPCALQATSRTPS